MSNDRTYDAPDNDAGEALWASSMFGHKSRKGLVQIFIRGQEVVMTPLEARTFALTVFEAADAAESDEFLMGFLAAKVGVPPDGQAEILNEFRQFRAAKLKENEG
jgi:hypothetical protein